MLLLLKTRETQLLVELLVSYNSLWRLEACQQGHGPDDLHGCLLTCATLDA